MASISDSDADCDVEEVFLPPDSKDTQRMQKTSFCGAAREDSQETAEKESNARSPSPANICLGKFDSDSQDSSDSEASHEDVPLGIPITAEQPQSTVARYTSVAAKFLPTPSAASGESFASTTWSFTNLHTCSVHRTQSEFHRF
jgi:hypothetical protein